MTWHEAWLIFSGNPALAALLASGRFTGRIRRVARLGWIVTDPLLARQILNDSAHFSMAGEGGVGHLWTQLFGAEMASMFTGTRHTELRTLARDLFTEDRAQTLVQRAQGELHADVRARLAAGQTVDVADLARVASGRTVADLLGIDLPDAKAARTLFAAGEQLAALALGTQSSTYLPPEVIDRAESLVTEITYAVQHAYRTAGADTILGRCREIGMGLDLARGVTTLMSIAGTETGASSLSRTVALLHDTGQQRWLLRDSSLRPGAVREGLRVTTAAPLIGRHVVRDTQIGGRQLRAGQRVLLLTYVANNNPGPFDIRREYLPETRQLWFGAGRHLCLGAAVARAQLSTLLETMTASGRPWRVVSRRPSRRVLIPSYASLRVRHEPVN
ncbi:MAG: cytochrome P450 [Micromonosporaceae bacterium]